MELAAQERAGGQDNGLGCQAPILIQDQLIGVLLVHHESAAQCFTAEDQETVRLFAAKAALAIRNASTRVSCVMTSPSGIGGRAGSFGITR